MRKVALITGGSRGLGATLAAFLAGQDWDLVLTARAGFALGRQAHALTHYGGRVIAIPGDVTDEWHRARLVQAAEQAGGIHLLVNNASMLGGSPQPALSDASLDVLGSIFATNVLAPVGLVQLALPALARRNGLVVNISSDAAIGGYAGWGGYGASKAALDLVTATFSAENPDVGFVSVDPGDLRTRMHQEAFPGEDISDRPLPDVTVPFWAWLLAQEPHTVSGRRFRAQADRWELAA